MIIKIWTVLDQAESEDNMDGYNNNENKTQEAQNENTRNQNSGQFGSNGENDNSFNNNGTYQGNDWQNGGFNNSYSNAGQGNGSYDNSYGGYGNNSYSNNNGYGGGYSDNGRQAGRRLRRSATNRMVCGVCAGIAEYFNWDPTIIRIIWVAASIFLGAGFLGVIAYFIVAVIMPER